MKNKRMLRALAAVFAAIILMTGCGSDGSSGSAEADFNGGIDIAVVTTISNNQPLPEADIIYRSVEDTCRYSGDIFLVRADGMPMVAWSVSYDKVNVVGKKAKDDEISKRLNEVKNGVGTACVAQTKEKDPLGAVQEAAKALNMSTGEVKRLIIYDNGISTAGALKMQNSENIQKTDFSGVIKDLKNTKELPDLSGIVVECYGIGSVSSPQKELGSKAKDSLVNFYEELYEECGAEQVIIHELAATENKRENPNLPKVTPVEIVDDDEDIIQKNTLKDPFVLDETVVRFKDNSAELVDLEAAADALKEVVDILKSDDAKEVYVAATTAYDPDMSGCLYRAQTRCDTIIDLLKKKGVDSSLLNAAPLGCTGPFYYGEDGTEELAKKNRTVIIVEVESAKGREITQTLNSLN